MAVLVGGGGRQTAGVVCQNSFRTGFNGLSLGKLKPAGRPQNSSIRFVGGPAYPNKYRPYLVRGLCGFFR